MPCCRPGVKHNESQVGGCDAVLLVKSGCLIGFPWVPMGSHGFPYWNYIGIYWNSIRIRFWMSAPWHLFMWTWSTSNCLERGTALPSPGAQGLSWECAGHRHHNKCRLLWAGCCRLVQGVGTRWISWNETAACLRRCQRLLLISVLHGLPAHLAGWDVLSSFPTL